MKIAVMIAALLLTGCATVQSYATCDNARIAIEAAKRAADAMCAVPVE